MCWVLVHLISFDHYPLRKTVVSRSHLYGRGDTAHRESDLQHHPRAWALLPHKGPLRQQFQRPRPQVMGSPDTEGAVKLGEMFPSRHRGAAGAEQEGLGGMFLAPKW